jgi:hypothetical protein
MGVCEHKLLQLRGLPRSQSLVHGSLSVQASSSFSHGCTLGSQVSPSSASIVPSPQAREQSLSFDGLQLPGQQPSLSSQDGSIRTHSAWQAVPFNTRGAHAASAGHSLGHAPDSPLSIAVSHFSTPLMIPSPQRVGGGSGGDTSARAGPSGCSSGTAFELEIGIVWVEDFTACFPAFRGVPS